MGKDATTVLVSRYSILPLAQDSVTRMMNDGLMIIDKKGYIVGMNPAVKAIFKDLPVDIDDKFKSAVAAWSVLSQIDSKHRLEVLEAVGANEYLSNPNIASDNPTR